jgi:preprotein translocase subunit SecE
LHLRDALAISAPSQCIGELRRSGPPDESGCPKEGEVTMARTSPAQFLSQVRTEAAKIVWPTRRETMMTALMVVIMTSLLGLFFFGVDSAFSALVQWLLSLLG